MEQKNGYNTPAKLRQSISYLMNLSRLLEGNRNFGLLICNKAAIYITELTPINAPLTVFYLLYLLFLYLSYRAKFLLQAFLMPKCVDRDLFFKGSTQLLAPKLPFHQLLISSHIKCFILLNLR